MKDHLPEHEQIIFRKVFNHALEEYKDVEDRKADATLEETAFKVAWAAVKTKYVKDENIEQWIQKNKEQSQFQL